MSKLTPEDYINVVHYHKSYKDISEWSKWKDKKELFKEECPELVAAFENAYAANKILDVIIESIETDLP